MSAPRFRTLVPGLLVGLIGGALRAEPAGVTALTRGARDPRMSAPGLLVPKVAREGPDPPYAAFVLEIAGAVRALYLRDAARKVWRIEVPWERGHPRPRFAVSLIPGRYEWVGFSHWKPRGDSRYDVYDVFDVAPVPLDVPAGVVSYGGAVSGSIVERPRVHPADRSRGTVRVNPLDFDFTFTVADDGPGALATLARVWPWIAARGLAVRSALGVGPPGPTLPRGAAGAPPGGPGGAAPPLTLTPTPTPARQVPRAGEKPWRVKPKPEGTSWGQRTR